jgi:hypothetical protein
MKNRNDSTPESVPLEKDQPPERAAWLRSPLGPDFLPESTVLFHHARNAGQSVFKASVHLIRKASSELDARGVAGGVVAMSAGEVVGMAVGGALGSVAGPAGSMVGAQLGGFAGGSLGARYGYEYAVASHKPISLTPVEASGAVLVNRGAERLGEAVGQAGGTVMGTAISGTSAGSLLGRLGGGVGAAVAEHAVHPEEGTQTQPADVPAEKFYRLRPTRAWFQRIAKEHLAETTISAVLGMAGGLVAGVVGQKIGNRAGMVAARRLNFTDPSKPEFEPASPSSLPVDSSSEAEDKGNPP